jgi:hypothetical protein
MAYASGKSSKAICDRCGLTFRYKDLYEEVENKRKNGLKVCRSCLDEDHPQLRLGEERITDAQSLRDPRPDKAEASSSITAFTNRYPHTAGVTS